MVMHLAIRLTKKDSTVLSGVREQETSTAITLRIITEPVIAAKADLEDPAETGAVLYAARQP